MDSTEAWERRKRLVSALSSRNRPSSKCSVSIYGEPNWLASYRAKKMTRRAFSVYRSNMFPLKNCPPRSRAAFVLFHLPASFWTGKTTRLGGDKLFLNLISTQPLSRVTLLGNPAYKLRLKVQRRQLFHPAMG